MRVVDDLGFNYEVLRGRYQHKGEETFARNSYQLDFPVRGRMSEVDEDEWSSESSNNDNPVWRALQAQLLSWMCNPKNPEREPEAVSNAY